MTPCVVTLSQPGRPTLRDRAIVVFPHAGGSPRTYIPWCRELPAEVDLYGVTYPGRGRLLNEPVPETLVDLAAACATELQPIIQSLGPVVLFGHSMGSYVAFEAARTLHRSGTSVAALVVSGAEAPHFGAREAWHRASDDDLVRHVGELDDRSRKVLAIPELRRMFLPIIRDDYRLVENYRGEPIPRLSCPIHVLYGESDPELRGSRPAAWAAYTGAGSQVRHVPGDHFYLDAHAARVVAYLSGIVGF